MFIYKDRQGRIIAKSESKIEFNEKLLPAFARIEPIEEKKASPKRKTNSRKGDSKDTKE